MFRTGLDVENIFHSDCDSVLGAKIKKKSNKSPFADNHPIKN